MYASEHRFFAGSVIARTEAGRPASYTDTIMKTILASIVLLAPLAATAQSEVYRALEPNAPDSQIYDRRTLDGIDGPLGLGTLGRQYQLTDDTQIGALKRYDSTIQFKSPRSRSGLMGSMT